MTLIDKVIRPIEAEEIKLLHRLREARRARRQTHQVDPFAVTLGQKISDSVAATVGSWPFIIIQSVILVFWMYLNVTAWVKQWDPYPFILLNLALSFQAAYAAPFIMMSQNRQASLDRIDAKHDYEVNIKAELEIELLHQKLDLLKENEIAQLISVIKELEKKLPTPGAA
jgi:uncharacterized membrane protein